MTIILVATMFMYLSLLERNQTAFLYYRLAITGKFENPPHHTFKKEMDWKRFFKNHSDRKWICSALTSFFDDGADRVDHNFKITLFVAWSEFNASHQNKILFDKSGVSLGEQWHKPATLLCADRSFLAWCINGAKVSNELEFALANFLTALSANIENSNEELEYETELKTDLINTLTDCKKLVTQDEFPVLLSSIDKLTLLIESMRHSDIKL